jgi:hypothetical protein
LIGKTLGVNTNTIRKKKIITIGCKSITYWGGFGRALYRYKKEVDTGHCECGCDLIPQKIRCNPNIRSRANYEDTEIFYDIKLMKGNEVEFIVNSNHNKNILKELLCEIGYFSTDVVNVIVKFI